MVNVDYVADQLAIRVEEMLTTERTRHVSTSVVPDRSGEVGKFITRLVSITHMDGDQFEIQPMTSSDLVATAGCFVFTLPIRDTTDISVDYVSGEFKFGMDWISDRHDWMLGLERLAAAMAQRIERDEQQAIIDALMERMPRVERYITGIDERTWALHTREGAALVSFAPDGGSCTFILVDRNGAQTRKVLWFLDDKLLNPDYYYWFGPSDIYSTDGGDNATRLVVWDRVQGNKLVSVVITNSEWDDLRGIIANVRRNFLPLFSAWMVEVEEAGFRVDELMKGY